MPTLLLFGATGDLSQRMLLPSLFGLEADGLLPPEMRIIGTALSPLNDEAFRALTSEALLRTIEDARLEATTVDRFLNRLEYIDVDARDPSGFARLADKIGSDGGALSIFLSTAPSLFRSTIEGLAGAGLTAHGARIALEKPLGNDLVSSTQINDAVAEFFSEEQTFRLDHYLGKETVQNLLALRFGNTLLEPMWNAQGIEHVQISVAETVGLEGRVGFYDGAGALRDMVQNHMLQLLAFVAMEPPSNYNAQAIRDEKVKVLRALRRITAEDVESHTVAGQYRSGAIAGSVVPSYCDELGSGSGTETFVAIKAHIDNWRWKNVPFYLRTGKRLPIRQSKIVVQFRGVPHSIFETRGTALKPNRLIIRLQPEESISLLMMAKQPGLDRDGIQLREVPLDLSLTTAFSGERRRIAYERLLLDLIEGNPTLFVRRDEVEAQWEWIDRIRSGWKAAASDPKPYAAGTWGPSAAIALTERDGVSWHD